jgi:hypothetical protein
MSTYRIEKNIHLNAYIRKLSVNVTWLFTMDHWTDSLGRKKKLIVQMNRWWKIILNSTQYVRFLAWWCDLLCNTSCRIRPDRWCADVCIDVYIYTYIYMLVLVRPEDKTSSYSLLNWWIYIIHRFLFHIFFNFNMQ